MEARHQLATDHALPTDFMRVRALPLTEAVSEFVQKYEEIFVVEMNRDGQMCQLLTVLYPHFSARFKSVAWGDGLPASAKWVREGILAQHNVEHHTGTNGNGKKPARAVKKPVREAMSAAAVGGVPANKASSRTRSSGTRAIKTRQK